MLFGFYILVFLNINYAGINCFALRPNELDGEIDVTNITKATNLPDLIIRNNATTRHFFKMIQNLTSTRANFSNLKSNVFDKMLSDEMLSIKEHLFEKELYEVSLQLSTSANARTPTLEIKQKWPFVEHVSIKENDNKSESAYDMIDTLGDTKNNNDKTDDVTGNDPNLNKKIVGLRSLSADAHVHGNLHKTRLRNSNKNESTTSKGVKICTCTKINNPSGGCNHNSDSSCKCSNNDPKACTRFFQTIYPTIPLTASEPIFSYVTYPTFLLEISTFSPYKDYYYHPNVVDDLKLPKNRKKHKHKHRTTKRIDEDSLYYDNSKEGFFKGYDNRYEDDYLENTKQPPKINNDDKIIIDIDYEVKDAKGIIPKTTLRWENGYINGVIKDKLVNDMVHDLKQQYADAILKDCYCSAFSLHVNVTYKSILFTVLVLFWL